MSAIESKKEWKYDAFISYRHVEPDAFVAGTIHKMLESYKLPGKLVKETGENLKRTKINKVFRDAEELPLTSNLNDSIMEALTDSEYLIVICSPRLGESLWCKKEIETFIEHRGLEHVLTVLVDGEPDVSFPEALLYKEVEVTQADGTVKKVREPIEPLAADARGDNNKERIKKLKVESLRLMAPMFGCSFDDLRQRQRERKMKRTIRIATGIAAAGLVFGAVSTSMALKISNQNNQIIEQNNQIVAQAEEIERQYKEVLVSNGNAVADYSRKLYEEGDRIEAIRRAYEVYPHEGNDVPSINKVEYVLSDALNLYQNGRTLKPDRLIKCNSLVKYITISPESTKLATVDSDQTLEIWDTENGNKLYSIVLDDYSFDDRIIVFKNENEFWYINGETLCFYSLEEQKLETIEDVYLSSNLSYSSVTNRLLAIGDYGIVLVDSTDNSVIKKDVYQSDFSSVMGGLAHRGSEISATKDKYFAVNVTLPQYENMCICVYDGVTGEPVDEILIKGDTAQQMQIYDDIMYIVTDYRSEENGETDWNSYNSSVWCYKIAEGGSELIWNYANNNDYMYNVNVSSSGNGEYVAVETYDSIILLDRITGALVKEIGLDTYIVKTYGYVDSDQFSVVGRDGNWYAIDSSLDEPLGMAFFESSSDKLDKFVTNGEIAASVPLVSDVVTLYRYASSPQVEIVDDYEPEVAEENDYEEVIDMLADNGLSRNLIKNVFYSDNKKMLGVVYRNGNMDIFAVDDSGNIQMDRSARLEGVGQYIEGIKVSPDGSKIIIYDLSDGFLLRTEGIDFNLELPTMDMVVARIPGYVGVDFDKNCVYVKDYNAIYRIPIYDEKAIAEYAEKELSK